MTLRPPLPFSLALLFALCLAETSTAQSGDNVLTDLRNKFNSARSREADQPFQESATNLKEKYLGAVEREMARVNDSGDLDAALLIKDELEAIKATATGAEPATEPPTESLKSMRQVYREHLQDLQQKRDAGLHRIAQAFLPEVTRAEEALTAANDHDGALAVHAYRESLAATFPGTATPEQPSAPVTAPASDSRLTAGGIELFDPSNVECIYDAAPSSSANEILRKDYYILEEDGGKGRLHLEFADPRFASSLENVEEIALNCRVADVTNAETNDPIKVLLKGEPVGLQLGAERGEKVRILLDKKAVGGANPIVLEVTCGGNAVILETTGSKRPQLAVKFE